MTNRQSLSDETLSDKTTGHVVDPGTGEKLEAEFVELTKEREQELEELEQKAEKGDADAYEEMMRKVIDEYCLNDVSYEERGRASQQAILVGFLRANGDSNAATEEAEEFFDAVEAAQQGNR